ncbi:hypothetical protein EI94DRAFT_510120 [Lactarius quietus]|nr:hypothetical protein EI94DRAFT_152518 [Lactarius quietus]KAF8264180.1 hypothetical protein EI94DRAFT_510120 [Lactarius quietus]
MKSLRRLFSMLVAHHGGTLAGDRLQPPSRIGTCDPGNVHLEERGHESDLLTIDPLTQSQESGGFSVTLVDHVNHRGFTCCKTPSNLTLPVARIDGAINCHPTFHNLV